MLDVSRNDGLPPIPSKRYFTLSEVSELCAVKPHVLRYWEREFPQLDPAERQGNQRRYRQHDILLIRQIRALLYGRGVSINAAREYLAKGKWPETMAEPGDSSRYRQLVRQMIAELEEVLQLLGNDKEG